MTKSQKVWLQIVLVILALAVATAVFIYLSRLRKPPARKPRATLAPLLRATAVHTEDMQMIVKGYGTVKPRLEVEVVPQVSGKVVACESNFVNGGFFIADQPLITIEPKDYELAVESAEAIVASARVQLDREEAEAVIARQEWYQLNSDSEPASELVFRGPQIRQAKTRLRAAEAQLEKARLDLGRTVISMPFDGRVADESVDAGQYVTASRPVATVYGTDVAEIVVPLEDRDLAWFDVPGAYTNSGKNSPPNTVAQARVTANFAGGRHSWKGSVVRTTGRIDPASRMVGVVVEVAEPFKLTNHRPPLMPGMFVEVAIEGKMLQNIIRVRRYAVHNGDELWVVNDGQLNIRKVKVARLDETYAYVAAGIEDGETIVLSPLDTVTEGMKIRTQMVTSTPGGEAEKK